MSSIDRRVVEMEFDNKQFEAGIKDTLNSLEALKSGLKMEGAAKGLSDISEAGKRFSLAGMADAVQNISSKFSVLGAVGFTVIQELTKSAMNFAKRVAGNVIDPIFSGGRRRAENIEQAKFQFRGLGMDVEATMASALAAVQGTAYGLDEAARAAGQFGASGMRAGDDMTSALRAISGVAAMTNSSYEDISQIFTKVAGNGRVMGDDLLRMSSRGLNAAATLADAMGISEEAVRKMVTEGKVSFEMFYQAMDEAFGENATKANETYAGSLANLRAALARIGARFYTPRLEQMRDLFNALSPAVDAVGEALKPVTDAFTHFTGRGTKGMIRFINSIDFDQLPKILTPLVGIIKNIFATIKAFIAPIRDAFRQIFPPASADQINAILKAIQKFTAGLKMGADSADKVRRTFAGVFAVLGIGWEIVKAGATFFAELFGIVLDGSGGFLDATANVGDFLVALHEAVKNGEGLTKFFSGLAKILSGPIKLIRNLALALMGLFEFDVPSSSKLSAAFEPLGRLGEILLGVWQRVINSLKNVWNTVAPLGRLIADAFRPITEALKNVTDEASFDNLISVIQTALGGGIFMMMRRMAANFGNTVGSVSHNLTEPFRRLTFALSTMQTTLRAMTLMQIAAAVAMLTVSVVSLSKVDSAGLTRALTAMTVMFTQLMASLKLFTMIGGVKGFFAISAGLILFATALRILVSSVKALAKLEWDELTRGLVGVQVLIGTLAIAVQGMSGHTAGMIRAGAGLLILAFGIKVLTGAVTDLAGLSWEEMARGLIGVGTLLASLAIFTRLVAVNKAGVLQGAGLLLLAAGIKVLAGAMTEIAGLGWGDISKGLGAITAILVAFAGFSHILNPTALVRAGVSLLLVGGAMRLLSGAIETLGSMSWEQLAGGLMAMGSALIMIVLALNSMPPNTMASAASLVAVSFALGLLADALNKMGGMSWTEIAGGLMGLGGALLILVIGLNAMTGTLPGAAAIFVTAAALRVLVPVLQAFAAMSIGEMVKSLVMLAGVFVVLGLAGLVLTPLVPTLLGLGIAIGLIGVGVGVAGAGVLAFSVALTTLAAAGAAGTAAIVAMAAGLIGLIPMLAEQLGFAVIAFAEVIATAGPSVLLATTTVLQAILEAIRKNTPGIVTTFMQIVTQLLRALVDLVPKAARAMYQIMLGILQAAEKYIPQIVRTFINLVVKIIQELAAGVPRFVTAATNLIVGFLRGVENNLGRVIRAGADVVIKLINGISDNMTRIVDAGIKAVINFINGVASAIRNNTAELNAAGRNLASAIVSGLTGGLTDSVGKVAGKARELASGAINAAKNVLRSQSPSKVFIEIGRDVGDGLVLGIGASVPIVNRAAGRMGQGAIDSVSKSLTGLSDIINIDAEMDLSPTIRPVLDLDEVRKESRKVAYVLSGHQVKIDAAYSKAKDALVQHRANETARLAVATPERTLEPQPTIQYTQNNYSPKALSSAEIYRQTNNQLSRTKGALTPNVATEIDG